jgi:hypothetical protein
VEAAVAHGEIRGYAKPIFDYLEIEPLDGKGFTARVKAWGAELVAKVGRNERKDRIATRLSFEGALNDPQLDIVEGRTQFFRNSFLTERTQRVTGNPGRVLPRAEVVRTRLRWFTENRTKPGRGEFSLWPKGLFQTGLAMGHPEWRRRFPITRFFRWRLR